jgi:hypothetical protein
MGKMAGTFNAFVATATLPVNEDVVAGTNATPIVQFDPGATLEEVEQSR